MSDLISRKALIEIFLKGFQNINYHPEYGDMAVGMEQELYNEFLHDTIKTIEEQPTALEVSQADMWIPITSGKLPEVKEVTEDIFDPVTLAVVDTKYRMVSDLVLVTVRDYEKDDVFVCDDITVDGKWCNFDDGNGVYEVIAWKPLPAPYKEEQE